VKSAADCGISFSAAMVRRIATKSVASSAEAQAAKKSGRHKIAFTLAQCRMIRNPFAC